MLGEEEHAKSRRQILEDDLKVKNVEVVPRIADKGAAIELARTAIATSWFDEVGCGKIEEGYLGGIAALENYQHEWDEKRGTWKSTPLHNWASNGADAYMQFAQGYQPTTTTRSGGRKPNWRTA